MAVLGGPPHEAWCPGAGSCLCGAEAERVGRPVSAAGGGGGPTPGGGAGRPPHGPPRPVNKAERRMVERGRRAGYLLGRHGTIPACPYKEGSRPAWLWEEGAADGAREGARDLLAVRDSYAAGLEAIGAGFPNPWTRV